MTCRWKVAIPGIYRGKDLGLKLGRSAAGSVDDVELNEPQSNTNGTPGRVRPIYRHVPATSCYRRNVEIG